MRKHFARVPTEVYLDPELTHADVHVYAVLAGQLVKRGVNIASSTQQEIADACGMQRRNVRNSLKTLATRGHIAISVYASGHRSQYELKSRIFRDESRPVGSH